MIRNIKNILIISIKETKIVLSSQVLKLKTTTDKRRKLTDIIKTVNRSTSSNPDINEKTVNPNRKIPRNC